MDKAAERAATAADQTRASVGKAVSEAARSGGGSVAVLTVLSELKPNNQGIAKALANALAKLNLVNPVDPVGPIDVGGLGPVAGPVGPVGVGGVIGSLN